jgi:hypothetical protein
MWSKLAAGLGLLAVFLALAAPVALLAEEVRTGKLGGLCSVQASLADELAGSNGDAAPHAGSHCNWCGSAAGSMLPAHAHATAVSADAVEVSCNARSLPIGSRLGLPFSRGPPPV